MEENKTAALEREVQELQKKAEKQERRLIAVNICIIILAVAGIIGRLTINQQLIVIGNIISRIISFFVK